MLKDLYFSNKTGKYYFLGVQPCQKCKQLIEEFMFVCRYYSRKNKAIFFYCEKCIKNKEKLPNLYSEIFMSLVTNTLPKDAFPVFDTPPVLSNKSNSDVFVMAYENKDGAKIIDRAIQSRNPNFMIQSDAKDPLQIKHDIAEMDRLMLPDQADNYLDSMAKAEILDSRFQLEDNSEEEKKKLR